MGGTLARRGGHNILEPAFFSKPVIAGPNMQNFAAIAAEFREHQAMVEIAIRANWRQRFIAALTELRTSESALAKSRCAIAIGRSHFHRPREQWELSLTAADPAVLAAFSC